MRLVLGCYDEKPHPYHYRWIDDTWTLSDIEPRFPNIVKVDARAIPYTNLEGLYASHILEHIPIEDVQKTLTHWHEVLGTGGTLTVNVPDMEWLAKEILNGENFGEFSSEYFNSIDKLMYVIYGPGEGYDQHKSGFTKGTLYKYALDAGFSEVSIEREYDDGHDMGVLILTATK